MSTPFTPCRLRHCDRLVHNEGWYPQAVHGLCTQCRQKFQGVCHHKDVQPMLLWRSNGAPDLRRVCQNCGKWWGGLKLTSVRNWADLPVWRDHRSEGQPCERCAVALAEYHHWAPRALFEDAEEWPGGWLCPQCHSRWHATMRRGVAAG